MKIFIGCSSSKKLDDKYYKIGKKVCDVLAKDNDLVFGACGFGIMGICYNTFKKQNKMIIGITPKNYEKDFEILDCDVSIVTNNVTERCRKLFENSDILVFLPGGIGTMSEFFSALEEKRNGMNKPIIVYNELELFNKTLDLLKHIEKNQLSEIDNLYEVINNTNDLVNYINNYKSI